MISVLRVAGGLAFVAVGLLVYAAFREDGVTISALVLAAAAGATGLFLFGFAANLLILDDIRHQLKGSKAPE